MGRMSAVAKVLNGQPKQHSKTQQLKREFLEKHPLKFVVCRKCGNGKITLFKLEGKYYCEYCYEKVKKKKK